MYLLMNVDLQNIDDLFHRRLTSSQSSYMHCIFDLKVGNTNFCSNISIGWESNQNGALMSIFYFYHILMASSSNVLDLLVIVDGRIECYQFVPQAGCICWEDIHLLEFTMQQCLMIVPTEVNRHIIMVEVSIVDIVSTMVSYLTHTLYLMFLYVLAIMLWTQWHEDHHTIFNLYGNVQSYKPHLTLPGNRGPPPKMDNGDRWHFMPFKSRTSSLLHRITQSMLM